MGVGVLTQLVCCRLGPCAQPHNCLACADQMCWTCVCVCALMQLHGRGAAPSIGPAHLPVCAVCCCMSGPPGPCGDDWHGRWLADPGAQPVVAGEVLGVGVEVSAM